MGFQTQGKPLRRSTPGAVRLLPAIAVVLVAGVLFPVPVEVHAREQVPSGIALSSDLGPWKGLDRNRRRILYVQANEDRQKRIVSDSEKLVQLATEFDNEVRANGSSGFSPAQLTKIHRIQKLARTVKEKMEFAIQPY